MSNSTLLLIGLTSLLLLVLPACGPAATPLSRTILPTAMPTDTSLPTDTPTPTQTPQPTHTPKPTTTLASIQPREWKTYRADSGYEIRYPLDIYSVRNVFYPGMRTEDIIYPGVQAFEPNDLYFYHNLGVITYKITIAVAVNTQNWSFDKHRDRLLTENPITPYNPASLTGHLIQEITLDGERAIRVDNVEEGPLRIRTEIVAIRKDFLYVLLVEPYEPPPNQAERYVSPAESAENEALLEEILSTFRFFD